MAIPSLIISLLFASSTLAQEYIAAPTVTIGAGTLVGTTTSLPSATAPVNKFLGVAYAVSPPERFSPPTAVEPFAEPYDATATKAACIQQFNCEDSWWNIQERK